MTNTSKYKIVLSVIMIAILLCGIFPMMYTSAASTGDAAKAAYKNV